MQLILRLTLLALLTVSFPLSAIIIRHDQADSRYLVAEKNYPQVFYLHTRFNNKICVATLINSHWAITAAHCADQTPLQSTLEGEQEYPLKVADRPNSVVALVVHPEYQNVAQKQAVDLALLKLRLPVAPQETVTLYRERDELHQVGLFLGWGYTGFGTVGRRGNDRQFRRARNTVFEASQWLQFQFDDPREQGTFAIDLEGVPGLGDSGGPALIETAEGLQLMGVAIGEVADPLQPNIKQGLYGAIELYERVSSHQEWIDTVISGSE